MSEKHIPVGKPLPASMLPPPRPVENCLSYWFPKVREAGLPTPRTIVVRTDVDLLYLLDGEIPDGYTKFMDGLLAAAEHIGYPLFLRSGYISGKHHWRSMCFVPDADALPSHVTAIVNHSHIVDFVGLPTDVWVLRELISTRPLFYCTGYGGFPVTREFRFFVRDDEVEHVQPYWPPQAVEDGEPDLAGWRDVLSEISTLTAEEALDLQALALGACAAVGGGHWSVDLLQDRDGRWWLTDMARGDNSFRWEPTPARRALRRDGARLELTMASDRVCRRGHIGGPGVLIGRSCIHAGPLGLAVLLGVFTAVAAASNPSMPWWGVLLAGLFWPIVSAFGQWFGG